MSAVGGLSRAESAARISLVVYSSLTLLAATAASNAKGYLNSMGEFTFVVVVTAGGLALAHFWAGVLAKRLTDLSAPGAEWLRREASRSSVMLLPGLLLVAVGWFGSAFIDDFEPAVTVSMTALVILLFAYTWAGASKGQAGRGSNLLWALGTTGVGVMMIIFKVLV